VEVSRVNIEDDSRVNYKVFAVNLRDEIALGVDGFKLHPQDSVTLRLLPSFRKASKIELKGEIMLPGIYDFDRGETLGEVIERAGGFTNLAFLEAAVFTRESLRKEEARQLKKLQEDMVAELEMKQIKAVGDKAADATGTRQAKDALLQSFEDVKATGRLVLDLAAVLDGSVADITLRAGDVLDIPQFRSSVSVIGEVYQPVVFTFTDGLSMSEYVGKAGGYTDNADKQAVYVIKASGAVEVSKGRLFSFAGGGRSILPGDTIVVPLETEEKLKGLPLFTQASQIIYQLSLGAAALNQLQK
jgi:protein involved in polysaccharide export with SLBB domain